MLSPLKLWQAYRGVNQIEAVAKEKAPMKVKIPQLVHLIVTLAGVIGVPTLATNWLLQPSHAMIFTALVGISVVLHSICPSVFGAPSDAAQQQAGLGTKSSAWLIGALLMGGMAFPSHLNAQAATAIAPATSTAAGFTTSSGPVSVHYAGAWSAAAEVRESFDFLDWGSGKANHLYLNGLQLAMPTPGVNIYLGGVSVRPNITRLLAKTNVTPGSVGVFADVSLGNGIPASGASHIALLAGGGLTYKLSNSTTWQPLTVQYGRFGGTGFALISTQIQYFFGK